MEESEILKELKEATSLLERCYSAIEPNQNWFYKEVSYKSLISESNKKVNELRNKYNF